MPRIVGRAYLEDRTIAIVGMPDGSVPDSILMEDGRSIENKG